MDQYIYTRRVSSSESLSWLIQAGVVLLLAQHAFGGRLLMESASNNKMAAPLGLRLDMIHVDSMLPLQAQRSPERLRKAVEKSINRAVMFARKASSTTPAAAKETGDLIASPAPVYSSDSGAYLVDLALGTPPQSFNGVLDTGSDLVWRQSDPCAECFNQTGPLFDPSKSSTYDTVSCDDALCNALPEPTCQSSTCNYYYSYGDGSTTIGVLSSDTLTIGGSKVKSFAFGAGLDNYGEIGAIGTDGIIGMGGGPLSLPSQMSSSIESKFSYCLVNWDDSPSTTSPLFLGSAATLSGDGVQATPFLSSASQPTFYYLDLKGISFNGKLLDIPPGTFDLQPDGSGGLIIDSGTTVTILVEDAYSPIRKAYSSAIHLPSADGSSVGLDLCYHINSNHSTTDVPPLTFHYDGADVELPPENIFIDIQGLYCLAFISTPPQINVNIYGNIQQQDFQFLYDKGSANQLSFKPAKCGSL